jgi:hypothetical protein
LVIRDFLAFGAFVSGPRPALREAAALNGVPIVASTGDKGKERVGALYRKHEAKPPPPTKKTAGTARRLSFIS